jgi:protocatechuate 3,4-dioxygenase beta subunit
MSNFARRDFLRAAPAGLAALAAGSRLLAADAAPTPGSGTLGAYGRYLTERQPAIVPRPAGEWQPTEDNILGPFYRPAAPFRAKVTPPLEPGTPLVVRGNVWGLDTRKPLVHATIDVWQANANGRYDNDDPNKPPAAGVFLNRARLITDESGYYEFETIHPGPYQTGPNVWRPSHIHYMVQQPSYKSLVTQLYFKGDRYNANDEFIKPSLIIDVQEVKLPQGVYQAGVFDIVLAKA